MAVLCYSGASELAEPVGVLLYLRHVVDGIDMLVGIRPGSRMRLTGRRARQVGPEGYGHQAPGGDELAGAWPMAEWACSASGGLAPASKTMPARARISPMTGHAPGLGSPAGIGFDAEDLPGAPGGLVIRAQPACRRPTAAFSIVGSSSSTAFAAEPSGMKLSSLVTRVIRPA